jgi:pyrroloquinoline quinone biosynthesis protein B
MLRGRGIGRVVYTHLNHTNPLLDPSHPAIKKLRDAGFEVAYDGMKLKL